MEFYLIEEVTISEKGITSFLDLSNKTVNKTRIERVHRSKPYRTYSEAEKALVRKVKNTLIKKQTNQEVRLVKYEFDKNELLKNRTVLAQHYFPLTMKDFEEHFETLEAIIINGVFYYVTGSYEDDNKDYDYKGICKGEPTLIIGCYNQGCLDEKEVHASELIGRTDVKLFNLCEVAFSDIH